MDGEDGVSFISPLGTLYTPALKGIDMDQESVLVSFLPVWSRLCLEKL